MLMKQLNYTPKGREETHITVLLVYLPYTITSDMSMYLALPILQRYVL